MRRWHQILVFFFALALIAGSTLTPSQAIPKGKWSDKTPMTAARTGLAVCVVGEKLYAIGGYDGSSMVVGKGNRDAVEMYDPSANGWQSKRPLPSGRYNSAMEAVNGKIYSFGGISDIGKGTYFKEVLEYDPGQDSWSNISAIPGGIKGQVESAAVNGRVFLFGGDYEDNRSQLWVNKNYEYDVATGGWSARRAMPVTRGDFGACAVGDRIYIFGGWDNGSYFDKIDVYNTTDDSWTSENPTTMKRRDFGLASLNGCIYLVGGLDEHGNKIGTVERYDPVNGTVTRLTDMPAGRCGLAAGAINGKLFAVGGVDGNARYLAVCQELDPSGQGTGGGSKSKGSIPAFGAPAALCAFIAVIAARQRARCQDQ